MPGMGLRARLALLFVVITVVPLTVAIFVLQVQLGQRLRATDRSQLATARATAVMTVDAARDRAGDLASDLGRGPAGPVLDAGDRADARRLLEATGPPGERADVVLLVDARRRPLAVRLAEPEGALAGSIEMPDAETLAAAVSGAPTVPGLLLEVREVRAGATSRRLGWVAAGTWADARLLDALPLTRDAGAALISGDRLLAVRGAEPSGLPADLSVREDQTLALDDGPRPASRVELSPPPDSTALLLWGAPVGRPDLSAALTVILPSIVAAAAAGWVLAGGVVSPVRRAADAARAVAGGDLQRRLEPSGGRELRELAVALNTMTAELDTRLTELRQSLTRLGRTLSSSLDLDATLAVVVETAMTALEADRGLLWLFTPERDALYAKVGRGVGSEVGRLGVGEGVAGWVAETGAPLRLPADADQAPPPSFSEPPAPHSMAVPMVGRGRVLGVLSLHRSDPGRAFDRSDLDTLTTFAAEASVAIENVMLHQEARRLSVTDPMTGLWNFRYFQLQADRELQSAIRFGRPLSAVIIDLDHFKPINDRFGHQAGDAVLIEVARRIQGATRVPDVVARYGGEEFVVLLPGTDLDGGLATAERIRGAVADEPVSLGSGPSAALLPVTASLGVATHPVHGRTVAGLVRRADAAMYAAKSGGRNRVVGADEAPSGTAERGAAADQPSGRH